MPDPVIAPYVPSYVDQQPYVTPAEYKAAPNAVNTSTITPGRTQPVNDDALRTILLNASSWADTLCNQTLAATTEIKGGVYRVYHGAIRIPVPFQPVVQVNGYQYGQPSTLVPADSLANVQIDGNVVILPTPQLGPLYVELEYVAGFANTLLTADAAAADTTLAVTSTIGIFPGLRMRLCDPGKDENVVVLTVDSDTSVTLSAPLVADHSVGVNLTALPGAVKQAVILLATALIKGRSVSSVQMQGYQGTPTSKVTETIDGTEEVERAVSLLNNYGRVV